MKIFIITFIATVLCSGSAYAGDQTIQEQFNNLDTNNNGVLTQEELQAQPILIRFTNFYSQDSFFLADINRDSLINIEEFMAHEEDISAE